jgi:hypothetical protein
MLIILSKRKALTSILIYKCWIEFRYTHRELELEFGGSDEVFGVLVWCNLNGCY